MLLIQWSCFTFGYYTQYPHLQPFKSKLLLLSPVLFLLAIILSRIIQIKYYKYIEGIFLNSLMALANLKTLTTVS